MSDAAFVSVYELAKCTGLPVAWLKAEAKAGRIPCLHVSRRRLFDPQAVRQTLIARSDCASADQTARAK